MHKNPPCAFKKFLEINGGRQVWFGLARALPELAPAGSGPDCCTTEVPRASNRQSGPQTQPTPTRNCLPQLWAPFRAQEVPNSWAASPPPSPPPPTPPPQPNPNHPPHTPPPAPKIWAAPPPPPSPHPPTTLAKPNQSILVHTRSPQSNLSNIHSSIFGWKYFDHELGGSGFRWFMGNQICLFNKQTHKLTGKPPAKIGYRTRKIYCTKNVYLNKNCMTFHEFTIFS